MWKLHLCSTLATTVVMCSVHAQAGTQPRSNVQDEARVTVVSGESWLSHLHRSFDNTSMGKTGRLGPGPQEPEVSLPMAEMVLDSVETRRVLRGSDLYRLNCQGCHGESGEGAPPEINSVINPVRATSVPLVMARMKSAGIDMSYAEAANLAQQSKKALLERLHNGGENMPSFSHLSAAEVNSLLVYLNHLAQVPGVSEDRTVTESRERLGELIVKSTCHTCHSAVGTNPGPQELLEGAIPPLSTLTSRRTQPELIRKVTRGYPVLMGVPTMPYRGRMPVFFYLSAEEAADVYLYLTRYPPSDRGTNPSVVVASLGRGNQAGPSGESSARRASMQDEGGSPAMWGSQTLLVAGVVPMVVLALAGGLYFTFREFRRLSGACISRDPAADSFGVDTPMSSSSDAFEPAVPLQHGTVNRSEDYQH